ncbi:MAG: zinc ribbon domain-containing protein [Gemmatimonadota bacterium]
MMNQDVLQRFHRVLVSALRERDPEHMARPFTVAEIYQDLVPYAVYREVLGVEMNGDYEHALLRLLSGDGGFVELESDAALREIRDELDSNNPNTGLYREFAAVDARLNVARIEDATPDAGGGTSVATPTRGTPSQLEVDMDDATEERQPDMESEEIQNVPLAAFAASGPLDPEMVDERGGRDGGQAAPDVCRWCREDLPRRDNLNFCPFCGTDVSLVPCSACGEAIEPNWRFCIACGTKAPEED